MLLPDQGGAGSRATLKQALHAFLSAGRIWINGSMFFLPEDLPQFGTQVYRRPPPAAGR
jgi:hypothetical protein